jgi:ADP-ribose pyrophosphatase YjhB (NUDIX family)
LKTIKARYLSEKGLGSHAQKHSIPGGRLHISETFEEGATREVKEETNLNIQNPKVIAVTNNLETFKEEEIHFISIVLLVKQFSGDLKIMEPDKCEKWLWCDPTNLPEPHFDASSRAVDCYLEKLFYKKYE